MLPQTFCTKSTRLPMRCLLAPSHVFTMTLVNITTIVSLILFVVLLLVLTFSNRKLSPTNNSNGVFSLFSRCSPTEISYVIIRLVSVDMVNRRFIIWIVDKSFRYESMHTISLAVYFNSTVALYIKTTIGPMQHEPRYTTIIWHKYSAIFSHLYTQKRMFFNPQFHY